MVQIDQIKLSLADQEVVCDHDATDWGDEDSVSGHEGEELRRAVDYQPGYHCPGAKEDTEDSASTDIHPGWEDGHSVVAEGYSVGREITGNLGEQPEDSAAER